MSARIYVRVALVLVLAPLAGCGDPGIRGGLSDSNRCGGPCSLEFDTVATLGRDRAEVYPAEMATAIQRGDGTFLVAPTDHPGTIAIYSPEGAFTGTFGRAGEGPGEYDLALVRLHRGTGDTVSIVDAFRLRRTTIGSDGAVARMHPIPAMLPGYLELGGKPYFQAALKGNDGKTRLLHELSDDGEVIASHLVLEEPSPADAYRATAVAEDGIWLAHRTQYRADFLKSPDFQAAASVEPEASWFPPNASEFVDPRVDRPEPKIVALQQDQDGLLWFLITVADEDWEPLEAEGEVAVTVELSARFRDWVLEVVDPSANARLANYRSDWPMLLGSGDGLVYHVSRGGDGQVVLTATQPRLVAR